MVFALVHCTQTGLQGVIPKNAIVEREEDVAVCMIMGKSHNVTILGCNNDYGILDQVATSHNTKRLRVLVERKSAIGRQQKEGTVHVEGITCIGIPSMSQAIPMIDVTSAFTSTSTFSSTSSSLSDVTSTSTFPSTSCSLSRFRHGQLETIVEETSDIDTTCDKKTYKRRICNKANICKFCNQSRTNLRRHIMAMHKEEPEVEDFIMLSDDNPLKKEKLSQMRRDGNFSLFRKSEKIIPARISRYVQPSKPDYLACPWCKILLKKDSLSKHIKNACKNTTSRSSKGMMMKSKAISESFHHRANDVMKNFIFPALRDGLVKETIRHDLIIVVYGNEMACKYRSQHHFAMIRNRLIRIAKILIKIKKVNPSVKQFADVLRPQMYDTLIDVINSMGEYDERTGNYRKPTLPTEIGTSLKYVIQLHISECIKSNDLEGKTAAKNLLHLLKTSLPAHVNKTASESLLNQKRSKNVILPSTSDIETLNKYVLRKRNEYHDKLIKQFDLDTWTQLSSFTLISILIFNRRRPGELERSLLTDLDTLSTIDENTQTYQNLKEQDKAYVKEYGRFVIRGKLARGVPVLLHKSMEASLRLVLQHRGDAGVSAGNPYIFGLPQAENGKNVVYRYLSATSLMRKYSVDCGASDPKSLRATALRKHVATKSISLNLDNEDLQQLQGYLGHADKIHREYYRQPIIERDIINVGKVLLAAQRTSPLSTGTYIDPPTTCITTLPPGTPVTSRRVIYTTPNHASPVAGPSNIQRRSSSDYAPSSDNSCNSDELIPATPKRKRRRLMELSPGQASIKRPWETPERQSARKLFSSHIEKGTIPATAEIVEVVGDCEELKRRTVPQIKLWLTNSKSRKTKKTWDTPAKHAVKRLFQRHIEGLSSPYPSKCAIQEAIDSHKELATLTPRRVQSQIQQQRKKYRALVKRT